MPVPPPTHGSASRRTGEAMVVTAGFAPLGACAVNQVTELVPPGDAELGYERYSWWRTGTASC